MSKSMSTIHHFERLSIWRVGAHASGDTPRCLARMMGIFPNHALRRNLFEDMHLNQIRCPRGFSMRA
jgi:hypothetical protein